MTPAPRPTLLAKLRACSWRDRGLLLEALLALAIARAALLLIPFRRLTPLLGPARTQAQTVPTPAQAAAARRIGWAVAAVASRHLGMSVFGYLREQRLQQARSLLAQGRQNIEAVAGTVGYQNGRDLARAFRQRFGVAPSALARAPFSQPLSP